MFRISLNLAVFYPNGIIHYFIGEEAITIEASAIKLLSDEIKASIESQTKSFLSYSSLQPGGFIKPIMEGFEVVRKADIGEVELLEDYLDGIAKVTT